MNCAFCYSYLTLLFIELMRNRDKLLAELNHISKTKRMGSAEDSAKSDCSNLNSQLNTLKEELVIT